MMLTILCVNRNGKKCAPPSSYRMLPRAERCPDRKPLVILYNSFAGDSLGGNDEPMAREVGSNNRSECGNRHGAGARAGRGWNESRSYSAKAGPPRGPRGRVEHQAWH